MWVLMYLVRWEEAADRQLKVLSSGSQAWLQSQSSRGPCLLRNLHAGQEATVRTLYETTGCSRPGRKYDRAVCVTLWFNLCTEHIMRSAGLDELQAGIKMGRRNINNLRYADDTTLMAESKEELKSLLIRVKEETESSGLRLNIKKTRIMASDPVTAWQIEGEKVGAVTDFLFLGSKITVDSDCTHEIRKQLLLGRKVMTNLGSCWKAETLPTKVHIVKAMIFPVVMYSCESWTIKKTERQRIDDFKLWCWRRLLKVPWTARRSKQSILREIGPEHSL